MSIDQDKFMTDEHLEFIDSLVESGVTRLISIQSLLMDKFPELGIVNVILVARYWQSVRSQAEIGAEENNARICSR
jgi:hypothetical protein